ncbi:MAG: hypothetical protein ABSH05_07500 [Bryobacteraceae bacterium]|jgi:hypothetical protein
MATGIYSKIRTAFRNLKPREVRELAGRPLRVGLIASSRERYAELEDALAPPGASHARRLELARVLDRADDPGAFEQFDLLLCEEELLCPPGAFRFDSSDPGRTVRQVLAARKDLELALARHLEPFRRPVISRIIRKIAKENAAFSLLTALPDVLPSLAELPWAAGEFASDTAFLTMNQVRMAFLIAAASDQDVGYREQRAQIAAIVGGAVGWRALARELAGKIPFGGGLIPKTAIAYAGTCTVGVGLERYYRIGRALTRQERSEVYERALRQGREVARALMELRRSA